MGIMTVLASQGIINAIMCNRPYTPFVYREASGEIWLKIQTGEEVRMRFNEDSVKIYESYRYDSAVYEIIAFVRAYSQKSGYEITRENAELVGEVKLHNRLYFMGYERERTRDSDIEYTADSRWYVNEWSQILGLIGT